MKDISQIMRQAQAMQAKINEAQKKLEAMEVEGSGRRRRGAYAPLGQERAARHPYRPIAVAADDAKFSKT